MTDHTYASSNGTESLFLSGSQWTFARNLITTKVPGLSSRPIKRTFTNSRKLLTNPRMIKMNRRYWDDLIDESQAFFDRRDYVNDPDLMLDCVPKAMLELMR